MILVRGNVERRNGMEVKISNSDSILDSIKKLLGPGSEHDAFDMDVLIFINSVFSDLHQIGVGPIEGFTIEDNTTTWEDYTDDIITLNSIKPYIYLKVRLMFDPPTSSSVLESMKNIAKEFEWRINMRAEHLRLAREEVT